MIRAISRRTSRTRPGISSSWVARIHPGRIMFEIDGVQKNLAVEAFQLASAKLSIKSRIVARDE